MPQADPRQGFTGLPLYPETYQIPDTLAAMYNFMLDRVVEQFPDTTARDTAIPSPTDQMVCATGSGGAVTVWIYAGGWKVVWSEWTTYTPTVQGVTLSTNGTGSIVGRYQKIARSVFYSVAITLGTGGVLTGQPVVSLPLTRQSTSTNDVNGSCLLLDSSATARRAWSSLITGSGTVVPCGPSGETVSATSPWTWAAGDQIVFRGAYEASS